MSTPPPLLLRPYRADTDLPAIEAVRAAVRAVDGEVRMPGPDTVDDPERHLPHCMIAEYAGQVAGYTWLTWWQEADGTRLYLLLGGVVPRWRRHGIGRAMLAWQEQDAAALAATHGPDGTAMFGANAGEQQPAARALLLGTGYQLAFTGVQLTSDLSAGPPPAAELPAGLTVRPAGPEHKERIYQVNEEIFGDTHRGLAHIPHTTSDYEEDTADTGLWHVAWDGDEPAGWALTTIGEDGVGVTPWVAVRPAWRGRGLARALVGLSLREFAARGVTTARINTIAENPFHTVAMYEGAGYRVTARFPRYRKPIAT